MLAVRIEVGKRRNALDTFGNESANIAVVTETTRRTMILLRLLLVPFMRT
jgi:hypothetical protein